MTRILIRGGHVVALGTLGVMTNASIIVEDGIIQSITPSEQSSELGNFDEVLGDESSIVLPGFINCHYHSELAVGPGLYQYIFELANISIQGSAGHLSEQDIYDIVQYGLALAIRGGQTAVLDMFYGRPLLADFGTEAALTAYKDIGMRVAFGLVSRDQNLYVHQDNDEFLAGLPLELADEIRRSPMGYAWPLDRVMSTYRSLVRTWDGHDGRVRIVLAPDWTPACSDDLYRQCRLLADEDGTGIVSHVLETRSEMLWSLKQYGKPAVIRLRDLGVLGPDMTCTHFIWVSDAEIPVFADSGAVASNNPGSNLRLSSGICRTRDLMNAGSRVAFGTDGISFSDSEDMFTELRLASYLQRFPREFDVIRLDSETLLKAAAENGAQAIRQRDQLGELSPGKSADILVLDGKRILFPRGRYREDEFLDVLIDRAQAQDLRSSLINGRVVLRERRLTTVDEDALLGRLQEAVDRRVYKLDPEVRRWLELGDLVRDRVIDFYRPGYAEPVTPSHVYNARSVP